VIYNFGEKNWKGQIFFSHGSVNSKGVAILFHEDVTVQLKNVVIDGNGRYIIIEGHIAGNDLALCNYYAPTGDKKREQMEMLDKLEPLLSNIQHKLILAGDLNTWLQPKLDKHGNGETNKAIRKINNMIENLDLIDIWRILNPDTRRYTWRAKKKGIVQQSRLDIF
jgi:exonuclease III